MSRLLTGLVLGLRGWRLRRRAISIDLGVRIADGANRQRFARRHAYLDRNIGLDLGLGHLNADGGGHGDPTLLGRRLAIG